MFLRIDKLQIEMPANTSPDAAAAASVQELLGGRFGEMSTLNNYLYQSFNMRGREDVRPFYELVANIAAEELGHIELVAATINLLQNGGIDPAATQKDGPLSGPNGQNGIRHQFINNGASALAGNSLGQPWQGDYVFNSGDFSPGLAAQLFSGKRGACRENPRL